MLWADLVWQKWAVHDGHSRQKKIINFSKKNLRDIVPPSVAVRIKKSKEFALFGEFSTHYVVGGTSIT